MVSLPRISRGSYYYGKKKRVSETEFKLDIIELFANSKISTESCKLKPLLETNRFSISHQHICRIYKNKFLSKYDGRYKKYQKTGVNLTKF